MGTNNLISNINVIHDSSLRRTGRYTHIYITRSMIRRTNDFDLQVSCPSVNLKVMSSCSSMHLFPLFFWRDIFSIMSQLNCNDVFRLIDHPDLYIYTSNVKMTLENSKTSPSVHYGVKKKTIDQIFFFPRRRRRLHIIK